MKLKQGSGRLSCHPTGKWDGSNLRFRGPHEASYWGRALSLVISAGWVKEKIKCVEWDKLDELRRQVRRTWSSGRLRLITCQ